MHAGKIARVLSTAALAFALSCRNSNTVSGPPAVHSPTAVSTAIATAVPTSTPTPLPGADLTGSWSGEYRAGDPTQCDFPVLSINLVQTGSSVTGTFTTTSSHICFPLPASFEGVLQGNVLNGQVSASNGAHATVSGALDSARQLTMNVSGNSQGALGFYSGGQLVLLRQ